MSTQFPPDQFDNVPEDGPVGAHRQPRSPWQTVLPFLLVLALAPALAWGAISMFGGGTESDDGGQGTQSQSEEAQSETQPQSEPQSEDQDSEEEPSEDPQSEPQEPQEEDPGTEGSDEDVDFDAFVSVLNASQITGLAGENAAKLEDAGFTNTSAGNAPNSQTQENTVFYRDADARATATKVGEVLGIDRFVENPTATGSAVVAVLLREAP